MSNNKQILEALDKRHSDIRSNFFAGIGNSADAVERTLAALDSPASYYACLTTSEREQVRKNWLDLASIVGVQAKKKTRLKKRHPIKIPKLVEDFFGSSDCIPHRPLAANNFADGAFACSWQKAAEKLSIQLNPAAMAYWLIFDCDHTEVDAWQKAGLHRPSFITVNPNNMHHHVVYRLSTPVCTSPNGRYKPQAFLNAIRESMRTALRADQHYAGLLTKNPMHPAWTVIRTEVMPAYTLHELALMLDLTRAKRYSRPQADFADLSRVEKGSRNRTLFDAVRIWSYANAKTQEDIFNYAQQCNTLIPEPLPMSEVQVIAKSISKYCLRAKKICSEKFRLRQSERGRLGGRPTVTAKEQPWLSGPSSFRVETNGDNRWWS